MMLQYFDTRITWREGKQHQNADVLSRNPTGAPKEVNDAEEEDFYDILIIELDSDARALNQL